MRRREEERERIACDNGQSASFALRVVGYQNRLQRIIRRVASGTVTQESKYICIPEEAGYSGMPVIKERYDCL